MRHLADGIGRENAHPADGIDHFGLDGGVHGRHGGILGAGPRGRPLKRCYLTYWPGFASNFVLQPFEQK